MKYLKLYEQFRLNESSDWKQTIEINGKNTTIKWGTAKLELAEIFQTLNHHKSNLPEEWQNSFHNYSQVEIFLAERGYKLISRMVYSNIYVLTNYQGKFDFNL